MTAPLSSTRERLILAAAQLFQQKGYYATSVADVLTEAGAPKGSLYHHFPNGKADLAQASAELASALMLDIVARAYGPAADFAEGTSRLGEKFARLFERHPHWRSCPVQTLLLDGPLGPEAAKDVLDRWIDAIAAQGRRLNAADPDADARRVWTLVIGAWTLARAQGDPAPLRGLVGMMPR